MLVVAVVAMLVRMEAVCVMLVASTRVPALALVSMWTMPNHTPSAPDEGVHGDRDRREKRDGTSHVHRPVYRSVPASAAKRRRNGFCLHKQAADTRPNILRI